MSFLEIHPVSLFSSSTGRDGWHHSPKNTTSYANEALRIELSGETPCVVQVIEHQGREMHEILRRVIQPGSG
jgi:hypothetical protein